VAEKPPREEDHEARQARVELLERLNAVTEPPMTALAFVWLALLVIDFTRGLGPFLEGVSNLIWALFILDFLLELVIAPSKLAYLRRNWLTAISLLLPALRVFRIARVVRSLRAARAVRGLSMARLLTSLNRGMRAVGATLSRRGIGYVVVLTVIVTLVGAAGMARFESPAALREAGYAPRPGEGLSGFGEAVWWTAMIMTTMGSEYWPRTGEGRLLGWLLAIYAFAVFGYITASIASHFVGQDRDAGTDERERVSASEIAALRREIAALRREIAARDGALTSGDPRREPEASLDERGRAT
jgi:voltage-gated potassium channel